MTFVTDRQAIATTLDALPFLTGHRFRPGGLKAGTAYPLFDEVVKGRGRQYGGQWRVIVILGNTELGAETNLDAWLTDVMDALNDNVAYVDRARAIKVPTSQGEIFALEITVRSE